MSFMKKNLSFGESAFDAVGQLIFGNVDAPGGGLGRFGLIMNEEPAGYLDRSIHRYDRISLSLVTDK